MSRLGEAHQEQLVVFYRSVTGESTEPEIRLTAKEIELQGLLPRVVAGPAEFLGVRRKVKGVEGLHMLMAFEIMNFIDGERSGLQIYEATVAEALQGGEDYYGTVTPEKVAGYLDNLAEAGLIQKR